MQDRQKGGINVERVRFMCVSLRCRITTSFPSRSTSYQALKCLIYRPTLTLFRNYQLPNDAELMKRNGGSMTNVSFRRGVNISCSSLSLLCNRVQKPEHETDPSCVKLHSQLSHKLS